MFRVSSPTLSTSKVNQSRGVVVGGDDASIDPHVAARSARSQRARQELDCHETSLKLVENTLSERVAPRERPLVRRLCKRGDERRMKANAPDPSGLDGPRSDAALLARFASGDQEAARLLTEQHLPRVLALANRMLRDVAEAEDVSQEAMLRVWRAAATWEPNGARLSTWLHRVTLNLCYDRLRKKRGAPLDEAPEPEDPAPSVQAQLESAERNTELQKAMADLPERQRAAIVLRHFEERSNPEIADALDVSVEAVESLLARGRRALKAKLKDRKALLLRD